MTLGLRFIGAVLCVVVAVFLWGCGADQRPTPTGTLEPPATPATVPLATADIFDMVSPSIVYIETAVREGSGVLIEDGYVLTNAQVVWAFDTARIVFPDGSEFSEVPVKGLDLLADLAVLGPIDAPHGGIALVDEESLDIGLDTFVIGYKEVKEDFPQPTISPRVLASVRDFESTGITYLQTDTYLTSGAETASDETGWVLVSTSGDVIGVVGFRPINTHFEVAASSADILPRVGQLIAGWDPTQLGGREIPLTGGKLRHQVILEHFLAQRTYVINESSGTQIDIEFTGDYEGRLGVSDSLSRVMLGLATDSSEPADDSLVIRSDEPYFVTVWRLEEGPGDLTLTSSHPLIDLYDPDDGRRLQVGGSLEGNTDFPGDIDYFLFDLIEGETVEVRVSSLMIDTVLNVYHMRRDGQIDFDVDGKTILFRSDSITVFRAPFTGNYFAVVARATKEAPGGYVLRAKLAEPDLALTHTARASRVGRPPATPTPTP